MIASLKEKLLDIFKEKPPVFRGVVLTGLLPGPLRHLVQMDMDMWNPLHFARQMELEKYVLNPPPGNLLALRELTTYYLSVGYRYHFNDATMQHLYGDTA